MLRTTIKVGFALAGLALTSCSSLDVLNATVPDSGIDITRAIPYGPTPRQTLDIYRAPGTANAPVVLFIHGGAWRTGSRADYRFMGIALARMGFIGVIADYRHYPEAAFPGFIEDTAAATAYTLKHAHSWGGDPTRLVLFGHSAGAHMVALTALDPRYLAAQGLTRHAIAGWIGLSGPYNFLPMTDPEVIEVFGQAATSPTSQPITYATQGAAPARLLHGLDDRTVYPSNTITLAAKLRQSGNSVAEILYPNTGHIDIILAFAPLFAKSGGIATDVAGFIRALPPSEGK